MFLSEIYMSLVIEMALCQVSKVITVIEKYYTKSNIIQSIKIPAQIKKKIIRFELRANKSTKTLWHIHPDMKRIV